jgi:hypothetical protein
MGVGFRRDVLKRFALNLNHLTLPEIKDFNVLDDVKCFRLNAKRYKARLKKQKSVSDLPKLDRHTCASGVAAHMSRQNPVVLRSPRWRVPI